jgi:hypothetical protein
MKLLKEIHAAMPEISDSMEVATVVGGCVAVFIAILRTALMVVANGGAL